MSSATPAALPALQALRRDPVAALWAGRASCRLINGPDGLSAAGHAEMGPALLRAAAATGWDVIRWYRPPRTAAFTGLDRLAAGHAEAWEVAADHGFQPVRRGPGGRMAAYHRDSLCIDLVLADAPSGPGPDPWIALAALAGALVELLHRCGVDARIGQVDGEYCPGQFSVNVGGRVKLAGTAARRIRGATLLSAVLLVDDVEPIRAVTTAVYAALQFPFTPSTVGGAAQYAPGLTAEVLAQELLAMVASRVELVEQVASAVPVH